MQRYSADYFQKMLLPPYYWGVVCLLMFGFMPQGMGQSLLSLDAETPYIDGLGQHGSFYFDDSHQLTLEQLPLEEFESVDAYTPNFGFDNRSIWFKFKVKNLDSLHTNWLLECQYPLWDSLTLYHRDGPKQWRAELSGDQVPFTEREIKHRLLLFELHLPYNQERTFYLKGRTLNSAQFPLRLIKKDEFIAEDSLAELLYGLDYGVLLIMGLYNLFLFFSVRVKGYLFYALAMFANTFVFISLNGHGTEYLWGNNLFWSNISLHSFISLSIAFWALFANSIIETKKYSPVMHKLLNGFIVGGFSCFVLSFLLPLRIIISIAAILLSAECLLLLIAGGIVYYKGNKAARFFLLAWAALIAGAILLVLRNFSLLPNTFVTSHAIEIGNLVEVSLLSLALADRYKELRKAKDKAQKELIEETTAKANLIKQHNQELEAKVARRTEDLNETVEELNQINEELTTAMDALEKQRWETQRQKEELAKQNESINSSINYARRIQNAVIPSRKTMEEALGQDKVFAFSKPRDIVSGDFYWVAKKGQLSILAVADCTGHGVPGAFMSMIGESLFNLIVHDREVHAPEKILEQMDEGVELALKQKDTERNDGMEVSICVFNYAEGFMQFAGARNHAVAFFHEQGLVKLPSTRRSIGGDPRPADKRPPFTATTYPLDSLESLYLFSDGFKDQFGGEKNRRFMSKRFYQLLESIKEMPVGVQEQKLEEALTQWMRDFPQTDDITVVGVKVNG